jgi:tRNA G18 (ribose-2'-O)-methylase SpoU
MRGFFGIGVEGISKPMNVGNLFRSAHAFGASFVFWIRPHHTAFNAPSDTSRAPGHLPSYAWSSVADVQLPRGCKLVGVELLEDAIDLPSFKHPLQAAYVLGPERGSLSPELTERCDQIVKIPTKFCVNVGVAGAIVMYDRLLALGRFADRPLHDGAPTTERPAHVFGGIYSRRGDGV